jgi:hypothetical protein
MKILHVATDDKFLDYAIPAFDSAYNGSNEVLIISKSDKLKFVKSQVAKLIIDKRFFTKRPLLDKDYYNSFDLIVFHSLNDLTFPEFANISPGKPTVWLGWGYDYYNYIVGGYNDNGLLLERTRELVPRASSKDIAKKIVAHLKHSLTYLGVGVSRKSAIERISLFAPVIPAEYDMVKTSRYWEAFPHRALWHYGTVENDFIKEMDPFEVTGDAILVGNSATFTCNHAESFDIINYSVNTQRKVIVPLSYGSPKCREVVTRLGEKLFSQSFDPLVEFTPVEIYLEKLKSCGYVIMNQKRQQALGNIIIMLYLGARVFVRSENPIFEFFIDKGVYINSIQELESSPSLLSTSLSSEQRLLNRKIISEYWSNERAVDRTIMLVERAIAHGLNRSDKATSGLAN